MKKLLIPPVFVLISLLLIVLLHLLFPRFNLILFPYNLAGLLISIPGFACTGTTWRQFKKHRTTLFIGKSSCMITWGIFGKTRNPMYVGMFLVLLGLSVCSMNLLSLGIPFVFLLVIRMVFIPVEEALMLETFGQDFIVYKKKVRRWV